MFKVELKVTYRCFSSYQQADNLLQQSGTSNLLLNALTSTKTVGENPCYQNVSFILISYDTKFHSRSDITVRWNQIFFLQQQSESLKASLCQLAREKWVSYEPQFIINMSKNFTLHFYLCIILPSNIIISRSCVISIRNQNDIRISCRVLILSERMEAPYKAMCSTRKPFRTPLKLAETRLPLHQDFYFSFSVKMPSDGVCS